MAFAIIRTGGKQYLVKPGETHSFEKLPVEAGQSITFDDVLLVGGEKTDIGAPKLAGKVTGTVVENGRGKKITGVKFHNKVRYKRTFGHRQAFTKVKIEKIG